MWEITRQDGSRRLKSDVVPMGFSFNKAVKQRKLPMKKLLQTPTYLNKENNNQNITLESVTDKNINTYLSIYVIKSNDIVSNGVCNSTNDQCQGDDKKN